MAGGSETRERDTHESLDRRSRCEARCCGDCVKAVNRELCGSDIVAHSSVGGCLRDQIAHQVRELLMCVPDVLAAVHECGEIGIVVLVSTERERFQDRVKARARVTGSVA